MKTLKKISLLIFLFCLLQWPSMKVDSASTAASSQLSFAKTDGDQSKDASSSSGLLGAMYRKSRQSRCVTCYDDRHEDRNRYYGSSSSRSDDRSGSWYYPRNDRYEDRYRGGEGDYDRYGGGGAGDRYGGGGAADRYGGGGSADRYGGGGAADRYGGGGAAERYGGGGAADRYGGGGAGDRYGYRDDRYDSRSTYDRYDTRGYNRYSDKRGSYDRGESRGYGYDNRDRYYGSERGGDYSRDRNYERPRYGSGAAGGSYDRDYYDRYSPRGQTGYDNSGRGPYSKGKGAKEDRRYLPAPGYRPLVATSPCGAQKPNCPYGPQDGGTRVTSGPIDSSNHNTGVSQSIYNPDANHNDSSKGSGSGWSYMREDDTDRQPPSSGTGGGGGGVGGGGSGSSSASSRDRNRDPQSPAYGALLDRGSNLIAVEPAKTSEDGQEDNEKPQSSSSSSSASVDDNGQQNANGQNS